MIFLLVFITSLVTSPVGATVYYVATNGNNANNGTSEATPKLTIAHCVSIMVAGDTCYVSGGTYDEGLIRFSRSGTQSAPIKLMNYPGTAPKIVFINPNAPANSNTNMMLIQNASGTNVAMGWITIEGFEITNGHDGIKYYSTHDSIIRRNWIHDNHFMGIVGSGSKILIDRNIINHNGNFYLCAHPELTAFDVCNQHHGIYTNGSFFTITNNIIYDNLGYGIQQNGSSSSVFDPAKMAGPEYAGTPNWVVDHNTFAYNKYRPGYVLWGNLATNSRIENNLFYENAVNVTGAQGINFASLGGTGNQIRNNYAYASGTGGTSFLSSTGATEGVNYTQSGNSVNISSPSFVNGGSNLLPASPDFRLTASSPVNIALTNEFLNNSTNVVGAFRTIANPTASIHGKIVTLTFPMSTAVPIRIPSSAGISINCTGSACPGSPSVGSASKKTGTDSQVEVVINGITGNACVAANQTWTISYNAVTGGWTGSDDIGPYPGLHQKIFSFTNLPIANLCDGTGSGGGVVGTPIIAYDFNENTGTTANNAGSAGSGKNGTLANGAGWTTGKTGSGVNITGGTQQVQVPYGVTGGAVDPTTQSMTWVLAVNVPAGGANATRFDMGTQVGVDRRAYVGAVNGTWRVASQTTSLTGSTASNLTVSDGWQQLCLTWNSATDIVTLYKNGVAGTGGATRAYTSFTLPSDILLGITGSGFPAAMVPGVYDDFQLYTSVEDCAAIYAAWNPPAVAVGTFGMPSYQFQSVYLTALGGSPTTFGTAINQPKEVVAGGAVAVMLEVHCENIADCEQDSFRPEALQNGTGSYIQIPNTETDTHIWMWGNDSNTFLNKEALTSRLSANSCTVTTGATVLTSDQVPVVDLPQNGCVVLRYIVKVGNVPGTYYDIRLSQQNGTPFAGTVNPARITVIPVQAGAQ